jgi:hypothetical protein
MLDRSSFSRRFADLSKRNDLRIILKKEVASFLRKVYWFAPFGALASTGCRLLDLTLEDLEIEISPSRGE